MINVQFSPSARCRNSLTKLASGFENTAQARKRPDTWQRWRRTAPPEEGQARQRRDRDEAVKAATQGPRGVR